RPFIDADAFFGSASPSGGAARVPPLWLLPRHILEQPFQENKAGFFGLDYWREGFVGAGPFKMQDWAAGSFATVVANDDYLLGRPKIDQVEVRFFADRGALKAALLAGTVHVHMGR